MMSFSVREGIRIARLTAAQNASGSSGVHATRMPGWTSNPVYWLYSKRQPTIVLSRCSTMAMSSWKNRLATPFRSRFGSKEMAKLPSRRSRLARYSAPQTRSCPCSGENRWVTSSSTVSRTSVGSSSSLRTARS